MKGYVGNIEQVTLANEHFRHVIYTAAHAQLVVMALQPGEAIGEEVHKDSDQFLRIEKGNGQAVLNGQSIPITDGSAVLVPAGVKHNIINSEGEPMKLYTIYSPPHHRDGVVHTTKADADADSERFDGRTSEG